jgi:hypothetical protein
MYSETDLEAAIAAGALSPEDAQRFRDFVAEGRAIPGVDEEHFRLLTGFNDIFVSIATLILLIAVGWIGQTIPPSGGGGPSLFSSLFVAATAWGLAEFFTAKRRMALPSILLLIAFVLGMFFAAHVVFFAQVGEGTFTTSREKVLIAAGSAGFAAGAAWLHWRRFHVPITVAAGTAAVVGLVLALLAALVDDSSDARPVLLYCALALGIAVFLFAMRWDSSDPFRRTRRADVAFWLHLLAAPLIVHPAFVVPGLTSGDASVLEALVVLLLYGVLGVIALAIDRRALLASALAYVLFALSNLFEKTGVLELSIAFTALVIGSALLLLSAFWHTARHAIITTLPPEIRAKLPALDRPVTVPPAADRASR